MGKINRRRKGDTEPKPGVKRRVSANRKERRRTQSINAAFTALREHIPNVPVDTKLSKIKTLRLAMGYIQHLQKLLKYGEEHKIIKVEKPCSPPRRVILEEDEGEIRTKSEEICLSEEQPQNSSRKGSRTGWPQDVWALELRRIEQRNGTVTVIPLVPHIRRRSLQT